ncbi:NosD domain-containing protein [uncultured Methanobacterium sp.]|uniref:NosD domain-containing protein n=1 Tax=uncultured Methanobacterium sp. TaxID=176306 RepID=UPI002AA5F08F|nr:NosD domain-containing protein [uncultured Methanobacterium sp.]
MGINSKLSFSLISVIFFISIIGGAYAWPPGFSGQLGAYFESEGSTVNPGDTVYIHINPVNTGSSDWENVTIYAPIPAGLQYISTTAPDRLMGYDPLTGIWTIGEMLANGRSSDKSLIIACKVLPDASGPITLLEGSVKFLSLVSVYDYYHQGGATPYNVAGTAYCPLDLGDSIINVASVIHGGGSGTSYPMNISATPTNGIGPLTVQFKAPNIANALNWSWDFNYDGIIDSNLENPTWTYNNPGNYTVGLTFENGTDYFTVVKSDLIHVLGSIVNSRTNATYTSIQSMIDDVNTLDGDTILFGPGNYTENLVLNKSLILTALGVVNLTSLDDSHPVITVNSAGSGSVIQGFNINGALNSYGVNLDSANNVTLTNNTITGNYVGIQLSNSENNTLTSNTVTGNSWSGICLDKGNHNTISGNTVLLNQEGIFLSNSSANTINNNNAYNNTYTGITAINGGENLIQGNTAHNNGVSGILLQKSINYNITGNTIQNNGWSGICLDSANGIIITGNTVSGNEEGIFTVHSQDNTISSNSVANSTFTGISVLNGSQNNNLTSNTESGSGFTGILVQNSNQTDIESNTLQDNGWSGVCLDQVTNTTVTVNSFQNNPEQALAVGGYGNSFDGNYWSDWDSNDPRVIDGDNNVTDAHPQIKLTVGPHSPLWYGISY